MTTDNIIMPEPIPPKDTAGLETWLRLLRQALERHIQSTKEDTATIKSRLKSLEDQQ
jgi:hypothetical protein